MGVELVIMFGLGLLTVLFAYFSFEYREAGGDLVSDFLSKFFLGLSAVFIIIIINTTYMIADNNGLSYLRDGPLLYALGIVYYGMIIIVTVYFVMLFSTGAKLLYDTAQVKWGNKKKSKTEKGE